MAPRPFWTGYLKLSLVTCKVALAPAVSASEKVRFRTLNLQTGHPVISQYVDAVTGKPVEEADEVKGYPRGEDEYVMIEDDELAAVALESTRTIDIETFVPRDAIGWVWYDRPHYLTPDDEIGEEAFSVIRDAMQATDTAGIARLVLYRRERAVMLEPRERGLVLWTLHYGDEVRDPKAYFGDIGSGKPDGKLMSLVKTLIDERTKPWDPAMAGDPVQARLLDIIAAKKKGRKRPAKPKAEPEPERAGNVIDIMGALRRSIASDGNRKGRR